MKETIMYAERPLPRTPYKHALVVAMFTVATVITVWVSVRLQMHVLAGVPFFLAVPLGFYFFCVRRCPECGSRLSNHNELRTDTTGFRILSRCERCQVDWDTGFRGDSKYSD
jgi:hypothetical protein